MEVHDTKNNTDRLAATVFVRPDRITGSLDQSLLILPDGTWHLARPAQFTKDQHHIAIEGFALVNGVRRLTLDASIEPAGAQSIALHARSIDLNGPAIADPATATDRPASFPLTSQSVEQRQRRQSTQISQQIAW